MSERDILSYGNERLTFRNERTKPGDEKDEL
jgi:hypothetical protein